MQYRYKLKTHAILKNANHRSEWVNPILQEREDKGKQQTRI